MKENLCKQISLDAIKYLEREPDAFVLFYIFPLPFLFSKLCNSIAFVGSITSRCSGKWARTHRSDPGDGGNRAYSFCSSFRYIGEISWNERLFICYVRGMWLNGTRKMRLFAKENQDIRKISPTFFLRLIFMLKLRMLCSSCTWLVYLPPITFLHILQWHTEVSEETLDVKS